MKNEKESADFVKMTMWLLGSLFLYGCVDVSQFGCDRTFVAIAGTYSTGTPSGRLELEIVSEHNARFAHYGVDGAVYSKELAVDSDLLPDNLMINLDLETCLRLDAIGIRESKKCGSREDEANPNRVSIWTGLQPRCPGWGSDVELHLGKALLR